MSRGRPYLAGLTSQADPLASALLDDQHHGGAAGRAGAPKGASSVGEGDPLGTRKFPVGAAAQAEAFGIALPFPGKEGPAALVGALLLGPARGPLARRGLCFHAGDQRLHSFWSGEEAVRVRFGYLPTRPAKQRVLPARASPLAALVAEAVTEAAPQGGGPRGKVQLIYHPAAGDADKREAIDSENGSGDGKLHCEVTIVRAIGRA